MRPVVTAVCALLLSGCAGGADAALTAQDAASNLAVKDRAVTRLATTELTIIAQQARAWAAANGGSMVGFAADLTASQPSVASAAAVLTDASVSVAIGGGRCLSATLPAGPPVTAAC